MEHIDNLQQVGLEDASGRQFFGRQDAENAKSSFIGGFSHAMGAGIATGLLALIGIVVHSLMSGSGNDQTGS